MGECPDWWAFFEAATECNAPVWDVAGIPESRGHRWWMEWALMRKIALSNAREEIQRNADIARG